ncbi:hypothetical protein MUP59_03910 [Candidatus Bathyarchaeota archaeon]|nr:hypothetical protein [Candidatus Bathyarchaeota archaeon]
MSTIGDGVKIGVGFLLVKWLFGMGGCLTLLSVGICSLRQIGHSVRTSDPAPVVVEQAPVVAPVPNPITDKTVRFIGGCNLRREASQTSEKMGFAVRMVDYEVTDQNGKWRKIHVDGTVGWVGCDSLGGKVSEVSAPEKVNPEKVNSVIDVIDKVDKYVQARDQLRVKMDKYIQDNPPPTMESIKKEEEEWRRSRTTRKEEGD